MKINITDSDIPVGEYCYTILSVNNGRIQTKVCPYWSGVVIIDDEKIGYCSKLNVDDSMDDYGLLFDQVKYCGINIDEDE